MALSAAEREARYRAKRNAVYASMSPIVCACGCGTLVPPINKQGKFARYAHGHNPTTGRFQKGHASPNKGRKCPWASALHKGKRLSPDEIARRTATRLARNGGVYQFGGYHWSEDAKRQQCLRFRTIWKGRSAGPNNPAWMGGKSLEAYGEDFTDELKEVVLARDGHRCVNCGIGGSERRLVVHHKDADKKNNRLANLETLCESCHGRHHGKLLQNIRVGKR